jgi:hypothetical protein
MIYVAGDCATIEFPLRRTLQASVRYWANQQYKAYVNKFSFLFCN